MSPKKFRTKKRTVGNKALRQRMKDLKNKKGLKSISTRIDIEQTEEIVESQCNNISITVTDNSNDKLVDSFSGSDFDQTLSLDCNDIFEGAPLSELNISGIEPMEPSLSTLSNKSYLSQSDDLSVSSHLLNVQQVDDTENSSSEYIDTKSCLSGRRIVDIFFFIQQIQVRHSGGMDCSFIDMQFQSEKIYGFHSVFNFKCKMCGITSKIYSAENAQQKCLPINKAIISGCQAIGIGHTQMSEFAAFLEMPSLSCTGFVKLQSVVANSIHDSAWEEIRKAGEEEKRIALECGSIDSDGIPMCTVVADGQWSKRSYKTKYDALSGAVAIIGLKTQKILFIGIKNKYCVICQKSATKNEIASKHECFMNWTKSSTSMEADGVVEGFMNSIKMHGLKYNRLIGNFICTG
ncbi:uncharacterized protein LOC111039042 [Myzus persicae]|uniref:uncharacterized protein LOC111039042 n=1 Tax=Myzus persicae TaxID=13164 RepID=UPI000B9376FC|nr:uncharacterized protein LOC111039042 [Myzus persicae]